MAIWSDKLLIDQDHLAEMCFGGRLYCPNCPPHKYFVNPQKAETYPLPLVAASGDIRITDLVAEVTVRQRYENRESTPLEVVYEFPLPARAVVSYFEALIDDAKVVGEVKEKEQAENEYDDAIASGHGAYMLQQKTETKFEASIGNFPPGKEVMVTLVYNLELEYDDSGKLQLVLPANPFAPDGVMTPKFPEPKDKTSINAIKVPHGLTLSADFSMSHPIQSITCNTHKVEVTKSSTDPKQAVLSYPTQNAPLVKDMVILIQTDEPNKPYARVQEAANKQKAVMLAFYPTIANEETFSEVIFIVDRSGSMRGPRMDKTKATLQIFLRALPPGSLFNIVSFGSNYSTLFPTSVEYSDDSLAKATEHVNGMQANMGGTEIFKPLAGILGQKPADGIPRQLFLLTDGEVSNPTNCIDFVKKHAETTRVFAFGIGKGASLSLVSGMAKAGCGSYEMIDDNENPDDKVLRQLNKAMQPAITDLKIDWKGAVESFAPAKLPPLFSGQRLLAYGFLKADAPATIEVSLTGKSRSLGQPLNSTITVDTKHFLSGKTIPALAAKALISDLEEEKSYKHASIGVLKAGVSQKQITDEIVALSVKYQVLTKLTAFIAVEERADATTGEMKKRQIRTKASDHDAWGDDDNSDEEEAPHFNGRLGARGGSDGGGGRGRGRGGAVPPPQKRGAVGGDLSADKSRKKSAKQEKGASRDRSAQPNLLSSFSRQAALPSRPQQSMGFGGPGGAASLSPPSSSSSFASPAPPPSANYYMEEGSSPLSAATSWAAGPSQAPAPLAPSVDTAPMKALILKQSASGFWKLEALVEFLKSTADKLKAGLAELGAADSPVALQVWATALAVAVLETRYATEKNSWQLVVKKARAYIAKEGPALSSGDWVAVATKTV